jgi:peptide chain release factor 1
LDNEAGGHRIQRVPPTERKGRVHTSTVTVAVIDGEEHCKPVTIQQLDLKIEWYSGTGAGGQHRNKHQNSCRITHLPTGLVVTAQTRSRQNSLDEAMSTLNQKLDETTKRSYNSVIDSDRKRQVGSGMRGDKIRTYRFQDDVVQDHLTGKKAKCQQILKGNFDLLWE